MTHGTPKKDYPVARSWALGHIAFLSKRYFVREGLWVASTPAQVRYGKGFPLVFHQTARRRRLSR